MNVCAGEKVTNCLSVGKCIEKERKDYFEYFATSCVWTVWVRECLYVCVYVCVWERERENNVCVRMCIRSKCMLSIIKYEEAKVCVEKKTSTVFNRLRLKSIAWNQDGKKCFVSELN